MRVYVNNEEINIPEGCTVEKLLKIRCIYCYTAVWINDNQILLKDYRTRRLKYNDNIKIMRIIGGG